MDDVKTVAMAAPGWARFMGEVAPAKSTNEAAKLRPCFG